MRMSSGSAPAPSTTAGRDERDDRPRTRRRSIRKGPLVGPVLGRVVGMLAARAQCPIDRLDDAMLLTDAVAAHAPTHTTEGHVQVVVAADETGIELRVGALARGGADSLLADAELPGVGNVFSASPTRWSRGTPATAPASVLRLRFVRHERGRPSRSVMPADTAAAPSGDDVRQVDPSS